MKIIIQTIFFLVLFIFSVNQNIFSQNMEQDNFYFPDFNKNYDEKYQFTTIKDKINSFLKLYCIQNKIDYSRIRFEDNISTYKNINFTYVNFYSRGRLSIPLLVFYDNENILKCGKITKDTIVKLKNSNEYNTFSMDFYIFFALINTKTHNLQWIKIKNCEENFNNYIKNYKEQTIYFNEFLSYNQFTLLQNNKINSSVIQKDKQSFYSAYYYAENANNIKIQLNKNIIAGDSTKIRLYKINSETDAYSLAYESEIVAKTENVVFDISQKLKSGFYKIFYLQNFIPNVHYWSCIENIILIPESFYEKNISNTKYKLEIKYLKQFFKSEEQVKTFVENVANTVDLSLNKFIKDGWISEKQLIGNNKVLELLIFPTNPENKITYFEQNIRNNVISFFNFNKTNNKTTIGICADSLCLALATQKLQNYINPPLEKEIFKWFIFSKNPKFRTEPEKIKKIYEGFSSAFALEQNILLNDSSELEKQITDVIKSFALNKEKILENEPEFLGNCGLFYYFLKENYGEETLKILLSTIDKFFYNAKTTNENNFKNWLDFATNNKSEEILTNFIESFVTKSKVPIEIILSNKEIFKIKLEQYTSTKIFKRYISFTGKYKINFDFEKEYFSNAKSVGKYYFSVAVQNTNSEYKENSLKRFFVATDTLTSLELELSRGDFVVVSLMKLNNVSNNDVCTITIKEQNLPKVDFKATANKIKKEEVVFFSELCRGKILSYKWEFEGGHPATASGKFVIVRYDEKGGKVKLTVTDENGEKFSVEKENFISVE